MFTGNDLSEAYTGCAILLLVGVVLALAGWGLALYLWLR